MPTSVVISLTAACVLGLTSFCCKRSIMVP